MGREPQKARQGSCPFCAVVDGEAPSDRIYEDDLTLAFLDHSPLAIGHCLLVPKAHVPTLFEADAATVTALARATQTLAIAVKDATSADGVFVAQNNVISQSVPHLHVHVVPRRKGDGLFSHGLLWKRVKYEGEAQRADIADRIRACAAHG